jgi:hypothetical protein
MARKMKVGDQKPETEDGRQLIRSYQEWVTHRYDPGYYLGGNIAPHLDTTRLGPRARRYSAALLGFMALVTALMVVGEVRSGSWFHLAMALGLLALVTGAAIKMYRRPGSGGGHDADGSVTDAGFIRPPVFVVDGEDVSVYDSLEDAMGALEGVDVEDGLYAVYDADGRRIALKGVGVKRSRFIVEVGLVQVESIEAEPTGADELGQLLLRFGRHSGWDVNEGTPLAELVELARRT